MRVNISLPDELHQQITQYCVKKGFKLSSLIAAKLSEELGEVPSGKILDPGFPDLEEATIEVPAIKVAKDKTEKFVKQTKKASLCPHLIMIGGACNGCGGIAK